VREGEKERAMNRILVLSGRRISFTYQGRKEMERCYLSSWGFGRVGMPNGGRGCFSFLKLKCLGPFATATRRGSIGIGMIRGGEQIWGGPEVLESRGRSIGVCYTRRRIFNRIGITQNRRSSFWDLLS